MDPAASAPPPNPEPSVFRLRIEGDEPLSGWIGVEGESGESPFSGWVELMAAITTARKESPAPGDAKDDPARG
jgi:hypothetical protein